jgi:hypothetical protein
VVAPLKEKVEPAFADGAARNYTIAMLKRWTVILAVAGAVLMCISCVAIAYALWPLASVREQVVIWSNMLRMP